jgi:hypothetical protein
MRFLPPSLASLAACLLLCAGCASNTPAPGTETPAPGGARESKEAAKPAPAALLPAEKAQQELAAGIASYEDGTYKQAARQLQNALSLGLEKGGDQARAHKYLAFMHCVGKRPTQCRDEFRKAFEADAAFDLSAAEAGHPTWGPVFRKVKAERAATRKGK